MRVLLIAPRGGNMIKRNLVKLSTAVALAAILMTG